jgi:hypothetical protein
MLKINEQSALLYYTKKSIENIKKIVETSTKSQKNLNIEVEVSKNDKSTVNKINLNA